MLRCKYLARNRIAAIRLNGKSVGRSQPARAQAAGSEQEVGQFVIHGGLKPGYFVTGINVLEVDVDNPLPADSVLWLRPEVSGIGVFPARGAPLELSGASDKQTERGGARH
jgi:hypothetical protein